MRLMHEAQLHELSCFVTLTYETLPPGGSLRKRDFQLFMKRLRKDSPGRIRFFHCGEYGDLNRRPHYHAALFGVDFADKVKYTESKGGTIYTSARLSKLWGHGFCTVAPLTYESAAYVAGYVVKKIVGPQSKAHYTVLDPDTGELYQLAPEYATMSTKPGLGRAWFERYWRDLYPDDFVVSGGKVRGKPPRYYDRLLAQEQEELLRKVKEARIERAAEPRHAANSTRRRLRVRETVRKAARLLRRREL